MRNYTMWAKYREGLSIWLQQLVRIVITGLYTAKVNLVVFNMYRGVDKSLARPTSRCILFDGQIISFDASLDIYIYIVLIFLQL